MRKIYVLLIFCLLILSVFISCDDKSQGVELVTITLDSGILKEEAKTIETAENTSVILPSGDSLWSTSGYTFSGWAETATGIDKYKAGDKYSSSKSITLYATWTPNPKITYDSNNGTGDIITEYYKSGEKVTVKETSFTKDGCILSYWSTSQNPNDDKGATPYYIGQEIILKNDLKLYAVWVGDEDAITITFDSGIIEKGTETVSTIEGNSIILPSGDSLWSTKKYTFRGWSETASGEVIYTAGEKYTAKETITLTAVWAVKKVTLTYNANDGAVIADGWENVKEGEYGETVTLDNGKSLSKDGYKFNGWTDGETIYNVHEKYRLEKDITLYAVWKEASSIKYYLGSGLVAIAYLQGDSTTIGNGGGAIQSKGLYWTIDLNGDGTPYKVGDEYNGGNTTLYAQYEEGESYNITYKDSDDAEITVEGNPKSYTRYKIATNENEDVVVSYAPTKTGYVFKGWKNTSDGTVAEGYTIKAETVGDITLVAVWEDVATEYSIFYSIGDDVIEATGNPTSYTRYTTITKNEDVTISGVPKRTGYYFKGWKKKGTEDSTATREYTIKARETGNIILVAVWKETIKVGETITNGRYPSTLSGNESAYAGEAIVWRCIQCDEEDGRALMISDKVITTKTFKSDESSNYYNNSDIRTYLIGEGTDDFINKYNITTTDMLSVDVTAETTQIKSGDGDKLFLLSKSEAEDTNLFNDSSARIAKDLSGSDASWWLRTGNNYNMVTASSVESTGEIAEAQIEGNSGVRPAFWLDLSKL